MVYNYNRKLVSKARQLRQNMTKEERRLWYDFLKKLPLTVHRQKNIGNYIVDFFIAQVGVIIEVDGRQHQLLQNKQEDGKRDSELEKLGFRILRYANEDINSNFNSVCNDILANLGLKATDLKVERNQ